MKPHHLIAKYDSSSGMITLSFDSETDYNIHLKDGFERAFDRLVDVLSEKFDIAVSKTQWVCDDDCVNCQETGTYYNVGCKGRRKENGRENAVMTTTKIKTRRN